MKTKWFGKTRVDASDLAEMLGDAMDQAFERHLPSPQDIVDSIAKAIENVNFSTADQMGKVTAAYAENQNVLIEKWNEAIAQMQETQKAMSDVPEAMQRALSAETEQWKSSAIELGAQVDKVPATFAAVTEESQKQVGEMYQQLSSTFEDQVRQIKQATEKLGEDLREIGELAKGIEKILHIQETVDGLMTQMTASDEVLKTFKALQDNLEENNKFLQVAAQPRIVRLVEGEEE